MTLRILTVMAYGDNRQALLLSDDDGTHDRYLIDAPELDAEDPQQVLDAYTALIAAAPDMPKEWAAGRFVDRLPDGSQPRVITTLRGC